MDFIVKNKEGKVSHIFGVEAELVAGILLLGVSMLGAVYIYTDSIAMWLKSMNIE
ncbi:MAG: hypothetical protein V1909_04435 [Candidatus Micrarchaeota archaeon]